MHNFNISDLEQALDKKKYILIFGISIILMIAAVCIYLSMLSQTSANNLMGTVDEISRHDVESIEGSLDNSFALLESVNKRMKVYDVETIQEAQEQLNLEAASSPLFNAIYLLDDEGYLYSSSYVRLDPDEHAYSEMFSEGRDRFVMLYDDANGTLETTKESLIYGIKLDGMFLGGHRYVAMLGRSDLSNIRDQLLIESFDGQGVSSVINYQGYYIVSASPATDLTGRNNFYDTLSAGYIEDGVTIDDVRNSISAGESFVINCTTAEGQDLVFSFAPIAGTAWSFILAIPVQVFDQRFAVFTFMTAIMLSVVVVVLIGMMALIFRFMKKTISANAESAARAEFLSNMSHEIRTPLNGIIGLNHLMAGSLNDQKAMEGYVSKLGKSAEYLLSLVNDILDVSKLQAGKVDLAIEPFNMNDLIENVIEMHSNSINERGIRLDVLTEDLHYPHLVGDEVRVSQILMNILSNAAKFTPPEGSITFRAEQMLLQDRHEVFTTISISDTGCGMTREFQQHLFDVFTQERTSNNESQKGTGLGMAISHMLAVQMGGKLTVESEIGKGSRFVFSVRLPRDPKYVGNVDEELPDIEATGGKLGACDDKPDASQSDHDDQIKILVAEDNELNSEILSTILGNEGYETRLASNGQEALEMFEASGIGEYAAILMDAQMPVMDGYEAAKKIRDLDREDAETVRIFACTASTFAEDRKRALDSGMNDFLAKPLNVPDMLGKLEQVKRGLR